MDFELTPEEKQQVIANRMQEYKSRRYNSQITLQLAEKLDDDDPYKQPQVQQAKKEIEVLEKVMADLQGISIENTISSNSNGQLEDVNHS